MRQDKSKKQNFEEIVTENFINLRKYKAKKKKGKRKRQSYKFKSLITSQKNKPKKQICVHIYHNETAEN